MGCFLGCFKGSKDRKRSRKPKKSLPAAKNESIVFCPSSSPKEMVLETEVATDIPIPKLRENQEQGAVANVRKKVTFDLNVTTFESATVHGDTNEFWEDDAFERNVKEQNSDKEEEKGKEELADALKSVTYPPNHRYQNCESSDDEGLCEEDENEEDKEIDFDEDNGSGCEAEEESYDSYFSLPMENQVLHFQEVSSPKPTGEAAAERELLVLSKGNVRDRCKYIHSVMNPVENSSHWKEVKVRRASLKNPNKENINESQTFIIPEPTMKPKKPVTTNTNPDDFAKQEITVDASLSNWLISPNNSRIEPQKNTSFLSNSPVSQEERPILGSLDMEDIQQSARTSSPRKSPSRSSVEIPIIGTVGGYWSSKSKEGSPSSWSSSGSEKRGIPNTTSKYREDKRVSWYCTPFETRLEKALELEPKGTCSYVESTT
ncbi:hypothetical protein KSP39_PZI004279 [Platanthera zijinensis]|uniref:Uncharacterized protein n=1 Tax=Platanthera zijinensis TaxID=2320716 RepID=A0AAP0BXG4_9ASPA